MWSVPRTIRNITEWCSTKPSMPPTAGDRVVNGRYRLHSRFDRVANYIGTGGMVSLVDPSIGAGPNHVTMDPNLFRLSDSISICHPILTIGDLPIDLSGYSRYDSHLDPRSIDTSRLFANLDHLRSSLALHAPDPSIPTRVLTGLSPRRFSSGLPPLTSSLSAAYRRIASGIRLLIEGRFVEGLSLIAGSGPGLTPAGDDFIAGWLTGLNILSSCSGQDVSDTIHTIRSTVMSGNPIVQTQLGFAAEGCMYEPMKTLLSAIGTVVEGKVIENAVRRICGHGASSGADFLAGFLFTFDQEYCPCH